MNTKSSPYNVKTGFDAINNLQNIVNNKDLLFNWTEFLDNNEVRFVYDMVSQANSFSNFTPTDKQSRCCISITHKISLIKNNSAIKKSSSLSSKKKKSLSSKPEHVAKRKAKALLLIRDHKFKKVSPSNYELTMALYTEGLIQKKPTKKESKKILVSWLNSMHND